MPITVENIIEPYLRDAQPMVSLTHARPAQACVRVVTDQMTLPPWLTFREQAWSGNDNTKPHDLCSKTLDSSRTAADAAIDRLRQLEADWDGSDAAKPLGYSLKEARGFLRKLSPESIVPGATLHADGHAILFVHQPDAYAELEFLGQHKIGFYARRGEQKWTGEFLFDGRSLPEGLCRIGFSL
jgi:hypothetical protein